MPILGLLGVLFIGLKLGHVIAWSWLWVLAPFWVMPLIVIVSFCFVGTFGLYAMLFIRGVNRRGEVNRRGGANRLV